MNESTQQTPVDRLRLIETTYGSKRALVTDKRTLSFTELWAEVQTTAATLASSGVSSTDRVLVLVASTDSHVRTHFALVQLGATIVPLDPSIAWSRLELIIDQVDPTLAITEEGRVADDVVMGLSSRVYVRNVPTVGHDAPKSGPAPWAAESASVVFHTSGTTGTPKGVIHSSSALMRTLGALSLTRTEDRQTWLSPMQLHLIGGHTILYRALLEGDCLVTMHRFHPGRMLRKVDEEAVTSLGISPAMLQALVTAAGRQSYGLSSLRLIGVGSSPLDIELATSASRTFGVPIVNTYGSTELGGPVLMALGDAPDLFFPLATTEVRIVGAEDQELGIGEEGELVCAIPEPPRFVGTPQTRSEPRGWYKTGDCAVWVDESRMRIVGRMDDLIFRGGMKVYPSDITQVVQQHPAVRAAAVASVQTSKQYDAIVLFVQPQGQGLRLELDELALWCVDHLAGHQVPNRFVEVDSLPMTESGKIKIGELRQRARELLAS